MVRRWFLVGAVVVASATSCGAPALTFSPETLPEARLRQPYEVRITVSGGKTPVGGASVVSGALPAGLSIDQSGLETSHAFRIAGTPAAEGDFAFTLAAWCYGTSESGQQGKKVYSIVVR